MNTDKHRHELLAAIVLLTPVLAAAQSSSLLVESAPAATAPARMVDGVPDRLSPAIAKVSLSAVHAPEARKFAVHGEVTIIVRQSVEADSSSKLGTSKDSKFNDNVNSFPNLRVDQLFKGKILGGQLQNAPVVDAEGKHDFTGDAQYARKDTVTLRIQGRIIDVKPNGTLVLEARSTVRNDDEATTTVLTGTCRSEDVTADNTVLSTQLYDLNLDTQHEGELRNASKKGLITKIFDTIFNF